MKRIWVFACGNLGVYLVVGIGLLRHFIEGPNSMTPNIC